MDMKKYLNRIGISKIENPTLKFLTKLQNRHMLSIPFEDLDIPDRERIVLDNSHIYQKIILTKRGGFCYELNGLFHWLLTELGFKVDVLSARVYSHEQKNYSPEFDHMTLLAHLEKDYLTDVGFGDSFRKPIEMPTGELKDISGNYRIININNFYYLQRFEDEEWIPQYMFTTEPRKFEDFSERCDYQQDNPDSHFRNRIVCSIATPTGRITLSNNSITITDLEIKKREEFKTEEEFLQLLKEHFSIELK